MLTISNWLEKWQHSNLGDKAFALPTFRALTHTVNSFHRLLQFMRQRARIFEVQTSVCSTLVVEAGFSEARKILDTFTVLQFNHITGRVRWELLTQKSQAERNFSMPTDNVERFNKVYGNINIVVSQPELRQSSRQRTRAEQKLDSYHRQKIRQISKEYHTNQEPGKVRGGYFQFRGPAMKLTCPVCSTALPNSGHLSAHLQTLHRYSNDNAQKVAVDIETNTLAVELNTSKSTQLPVVHSIPPVVLPPVTQIQRPTVPFQWNPLPTYLKDSAVVFIDTETTSGYCYPKGGICSIAALHEADNFSRPWSTMVNPQPYVQPVVSRFVAVHWWLVSDLILKYRFAVPHQWLLKCVMLTGIKPSDVQHAPSMRDTLEHFFSWASLQYRLKRVIFVAHNAGFDRSRILAITQELLPNLEKRGTAFEWANTVPLLQPVILSTSPNGQILAKSSKLSTLIAHHFPDEDLSQYVGLNVNVQH